MLLKNYGSDFIYDSPAAFAERQIELALYKK